MTETTQAIDAMVAAAVAKALAAQPVGSATPASPTTPEPETPRQTVARALAFLHAELARDASIPSGSGRVHAALVECLDALSSLVVSADGTETTTA